jgi:hypothetical protein
MSHVTNPNEDWRGVDVGQIRHQLEMSTKERVRDMVHAANVMLSIRENALASRQHKRG